jgi:predicted transcriptional regulator
MVRARHQFMLDDTLSQRLDDLAGRPGATKSAIVADAVDAWLNRRGSNELDDRFGHRMDRLTTTLGRIERNTHILIETLALFVRYELAIHAPLADNDQAGRAIARDRFAAFITQVSKQIASGRRTLGQEDDR